jgi:carbonic anhydrase
MNTLIFGTALLSVAQAAAGVYDYKQNGADWTGTCATGREQSPINF